MPQFCACSGALAAVAVGATTLGASLRAGATLLAFYLSSSKLTRLLEERKATDEGFKRGGQRDWVQARSLSRRPFRLVLRSPVLLTLLGNA
jgi:uncharacterized membrane protein